MKNKKICFISSSGGHFSELKKLSSIAQRFNSFLVVEKTSGFNTKLCEKLYFVNEINRKEKLFLIKFFLMFIKELIIFLIQRPNFLITTGALCCYPMVRIAKLFKKKVIYIESYARVNDLSLTGKKVYKYADLFFVQWPELVEKYPRTIYVGNLFGVGD